MSIYCIEYNNGKYKTIEGSSEKDVEEKLRRITPGAVIIQEIIKLK